MTVDFKSMRHLLETAPGEKVAMNKDVVAKLLDVAEAGEAVALALSGFAGSSSSTAVSA